jgi:bacillithiol synthase
MQSTIEQIKYPDTKHFSKLVTDYIAKEKDLEPFYNLAPTIENIKIQTVQKAATNVNRQALANCIKNDYLNLTTTTEVNTNIDLLVNDNTFTICTAHQPNIFTGHLYFVYKILHTVKLASLLKKEMPENNFVPVFYMGSEDADLDELGHINIDNEVLQWNTQQKGAVGRMIIDEPFIEIINKLKGRFGNDPFGNEILAAIENCYSLQKSIQQATLEFVNFLFGKYGVLVLIADKKELKAQMISIFKNEIEQSTSHKAALTTSDALPDVYKAQAFSRPINLFYLNNDSRERIELNEAGIYEVLNTSINFSKEALLAEIENNPQYFSPNVILRGLFQETIMPNIAFVGGGGEIAYWLQLKDVFKSYNTIYPILIVRNSFLIQTETQQKQWQNLGFNTLQLFEKSILLEKLYTTQHTNKVLTTTDTQEAIIALYNTLLLRAKSIDQSLTTHIAALLKKQQNKLIQVEKKFVRAEKRNFSEKILQLQKIKQHLFPNENLQERYDNIIPYYAKYGKELFDNILNSSLTVEQEFVILTIN